MERCKECTHRKQPEWTQSEVCLDLSALIELRRVCALKPATVVHSRHVGNVCFLLAVCSWTTLDLFYLIDSLLLFVVIYTQFNFLFSCTFVLVENSKFLWRSFEFWAYVKLLNAINHPRTKQKLTVKKLDIKMF